VYSGIIAQPWQRLSRRSLKIKTEKRQSFGVSKLVVFSIIHTRARTRRDRNMFPNNPQGQAPANPNAAANVPPAAAQQAAAANAPQAAAVNPPQAAAQPDIATLTAAILAALQAAQAGNAAAAAPAAFALTPGQANAAAVIDFSTTVGLKRYDKAVEPLKMLFDHSEGRTVDFSMAVDLHAKAMGWKATGGDIITIPDANGTNKDLIREYKLTKEDIIRHINTYRNAPDRRAQNAVHMSTFLLASLKKGTQADLLANKQEWSIDGETYGPLLFKAIINKAIVDNHQTTSFLEDRLEGMSAFMIECDSDINRFHLEFREVVQLLEGRGKTGIDKLKYLFKAYKCAKDKDFRDWSKRKQEEYDESFPNPTLTADALMRLAQNKYVAATRPGSTTWGSRTAEEDRIVALAAQVESLKGGLKLADSIVANYGKVSAPITRNKPTKIKLDPTFEKLKKTPPKEGAPHERVFGPKDHKMFKQNKRYYWCPFHLMWTLHSGKDCRKGKSMDNRSASLKQRRNAFQAFMSFLANDDPETCHTAFHDEESASENEEEDEQAFTAEVDEADEGYETEGSNTSN